MTVGLGTGSTAAFFISALAERIRTEQLAIRCVATSRGSETLAAKFGITTLPLAPDTLPDLTIDGADEADPQLHLIKGGGGALVREKLVASSSGEMVVIVDESKFVPVLGTFPLPVGIFPFGWQTTRTRVEKAFGIVPMLRGGEKTPFVTDDDLYILDLPCVAIPDPASYQARLREIVGVAEVGLFVNIAQRLLIGHENGHVEVVVRPKNG
jgi:ribose 5-phosphate isomerase A